MRDRIYRKLKEKSEEMARRTAYEWARFFKKDIYIEMTPTGYSPTTKRPKKPYYIEGQRYVAWETYPGLSFKYLGEVICKTAWWEEAYEGEPGTKIVGHLPRGQFITPDGRKLNPNHLFVTSKVTKFLVDKTIEEYLRMDRG